MRVCLHVYVCVVELLLLLLLSLQAALVRRIHAAICTRIPRLQFQFGFWLFFFLFIHLLSNKFPFQQTLHSGSSCPHTHTHTDARMYVLSKYIAHLEVPFPLPLSAIGNC